METALPRAAGPTPAPALAVDAVRPEIRDVPGSGIVEVVNYGFHRDGLIKMWVGEGDTPTPDHISAAAAAALRDGHTFYTLQRGIPPLRQALADYQTRLYGTEIGVERISTLVGGMQAIMLGLQAIAGPGDEIVAISPVWPNIVAAARVVGATPVHVPLTLGEGGWQLDMDRLQDACGPKTRALFVNSPGNPTGWTATREEMIALRDFARQRGIWLIGDEVYIRLTYDTPRAVSFLELMEPEERLLAVNSFSKNWAMTGWRVGWLTHPPSLGPILENLIQYNTSGVPTFLQHGAVTAITEGEPTVEAVRAQCRAGRDIVCDALGAVDRVRFARPAGAFYLFFRVDGEADARSLALRLVDEANVGLAPGTAFGPGGEGYLRLCFASSRKTLTTAMERLVPALG